MLPGLRFLFVAIVMSVSMMIFGLGAAALLHSAQQEVASLPTRHVQPEAVFSQQSEATTPTLAMLSLDAREPSAGRPAVAVTASSIPPREPSPSVSIETNPVTAEPDKPAAPTTALPSEQKSVSSDTPAKTPAPETAARSEIPAPPPANHEPEIQQQQGQAVLSPEPTTSAAVQTTAPVVETPAAASATTAAAPATTPDAPKTTAAAPATNAAAPETTAATPETTLATPKTTAATPATTAAVPATTAAVPATTAAAPETTAAVPAPMVAAPAPMVAAPATVNAPADDGAKSATVKTATLAGHEATSEPQTASKIAAKALGKRAQARHPVRRRRILRARVAPPKPEVQPGPAPFFLTSQPGST